MIVSVCFSRQNQTLSDCRTSPRATTVSRHIYGDLSTIYRICEHLTSLSTEHGSGMTSPVRHARRDVRCTTERMESCSILSRHRRIHCPSSVAGTVQCGTTPIRFMPPAFAPTCAPSGLSSLGLGVNRIGLMEIEPYRERRNIFVQRTVRAAEAHGTIFIARGSILLSCIGVERPFRMVLRN